MKTTKYVLALAAALIALLAPRAVLADTVDQFTVSGTYSDSSTLSGTITIDTTTGVVQAVDLAWSDVLPSLTNFTQFGTTSISTYTPSYAGLSVMDPAGDYLGLVFPVATLTDYLGGSLCNGYGSSPPLCPSTGGPWATDANLGTSPSTIFDLETGTVELTGTVVTPEPTSLLLLGTGLLSLLVVAGLKLRPA